MVMRPETGIAWTELDSAARRQCTERACLDRDGEALWSLVEAYTDSQDHGRGKHSPHTRRVYQQGIAALLARWTGETLLRPGESDPAMLLHELRASGASASTVKVRLAGIRAMYRALVWAGAVDADPFESVRSPLDPSEAKQARIGYSEEERVALLRVADAVDVALVLLLADAGLGVSQCVALRWSHIDLEAGRLTIPNSGRGVAVMPLPYSVVNALLLVPHRRGDLVLGFTSEARARQRIQRLCRRAGIPYRGVSTLRPKAVPRVTDTAHRMSLLHPAETRDRADAESPGSIPDYELWRRELESLMAESARTGNPYGVLVIALDDLVSIANQHGREVRDAILRAFTARIDRLRRSYDLVAHCPTTRFCLILKHMEPEVDLATVVERFRRAVHADPIHVYGKQFRVTVSIEAAIQPREVKRLVSEVEASLLQTAPSAWSRGSIRTS